MDNPNKSHRRFDTSPLLFMFSANHIDQSIDTFMQLKVGYLKKYCTAFKICYMIGRNQYAICIYKVHTKFT